MAFFFKKKQPLASFEAQLSESDPLLQDAIRMDNPEHLFPWKTFAEVEQTPYVKKQPIDFPNPAFKGTHYFIKKPVLLFSVLLPEVTLVTPSWEAPNTFNPQWPVTRLTAEVKIASSGWDTYQQLKAHFTGQLGDASSVFENEEADFASGSSQWTQGNFSLKISVWKPDHSDKFRKECFLELEQQPDLSAFYTDDYTRGFELDTNIVYEVMPGTFTPGGTYIDKTTLRYTPASVTALIPDSDNYVVWYDKAQQKAGFANRKLCHILPVQPADTLLFKGYYFRDMPIECNVYLGTGTVNSKDYIGKLSNLEESEWETTCKAIADLLGCHHNYQSDKQYT